MVFLFEIVIFVHNISPISDLYILTGSSVPTIVDFGMWTLLCAVLSIGMFNSLGTLWLILWSTAKGMSSGGRSSLVASSYMCCAFNSVHA